VTRGKKCEKFVSVQSIRNSHEHFQQAEEISTIHGIKQFSPTTTEAAITNTTNNNNNGNNSKSKCNNNDNNNNGNINSISQTVTTITAITTISAAAATHQNFKK
jgi:hypothetical protein